jgi:hypothetical protein
VNNEYLEYTIFFQNTGNDTAFTVLLIDTLSSYIDLSTFQLISYSHPVIVNNYDGVLWFRFNQIYLPDSNTNEPASNGYVKYRVKLNNTLALGNTINNTAYIYFDFNAPIITNTTSTLYTTMSGTLSSNFETVNLFPNPVVNQNVTIKSNTTILQIDVFDIAGKLMMSKPINSLFMTDLDVKNLNKGIYIVKVITAQSVDELQLIKQ